MSTPTTTQGKRSSSSAATSSAPKVASQQTPQPKSSSQSKPSWLPSWLRLRRSQAPNSPHTPGAESSAAANLDINFAHHTPATLRREITFLVIFLGVSLFILTILYNVFRSVMSGIVLGCLAAYLTNPVVNILSHRLRWHRASVIIASIILFGLILAVSLVVVAPAVIAQVKDIVAFFPVAYAKVADLLTQWLPVINAHLINFGIPELNSFDFIKDVISIERLTAFFKGTISRLVATVPELISSGVSLAMMPFVMYLYLQHLPVARTFISGLVPSPHRQAMSCISRRIAQVLSAVIIGQIYVALIHGMGYALGFTIVGIQGGITIGIVAGIGRLIPFADIILALSLAVAVILSTESAPLSPLLGAVMVVIIMGILDSFLITPKLMGSSIGVHPIIILGSVIAFSAIMGFWGMIVAIPIVALLKEFGTIAIEYYQKWQSFYVQTYSDS